MGSAGYRIAVPKNVAKAIKRLPPSDRLAVFNALKSLSSNPRPPGHVKLKVRDLGEYRIRVRDYRVRYDVDDDARVVHVLAVKHRGEAYTV